MAWSDAAREASIEARRRKDAMRLAVVHPGTGKTLNLTRSDVAKRIHELRKITRDSATKRGKLRRAMIQLKVFAAASGTHPGWSDAARQAALAARRRRTMTVQPPGGIQRIAGPVQPTNAPANSGIDRATRRRLGGVDPALDRELAQKYGLPVYVQKAVDPVRAQAVTSSVRNELDQLHQEFDDLPKVKGYYSSTGKLLLFSNKVRSGLGSAASRGYLINGQYTYHSGHLALVLRDRPVGENRTIDTSSPSRRWTVGNSITGTFRHEYGHASMSALNQRAKSLGLPTFDHFDSKVFGESISKYARTNNHELFAESFSLYTSRDYDPSHPNRSLPTSLHEWFTKVLPRRRRG